LQIAAAQVIRDVVDQGRSLDHALAAREDRLKASERGALREIGYGGCRHYGYLDGLLGKLMDKPIRRKDRMVHFLLVTGLYQIIFMRVPDHAAVNQAVAALGASRQTWARGLVNGVLRQYLRCRDEGRVEHLEAALRPDQRASLPGHFHRWIADAWPGQVETICSALAEKPPLTLRVNGRKTKRADYLALLREQDMSADPCAESVRGVNLCDPVGVDAIPMFADGWVSVQDESAQLCVPVMQLQSGMRVLDACAAPGGKSCAMLEAEPGILLTVVDLPGRVDAIRDNLRRLGLDAEVHENGLQAYAEGWEGEKFDRILLDVPCSGSGVVRRHPDIPHRRQPGDPERFAEQQLELLETAWEMLSRGGGLLYVTCSILPTENDDVIHSFLGRHGEATASVPDLITGINTRHGLQRLPGVHSGDGFYYCALGKL
jgi:16S rRNA (cytosine967-C5)-methyltransferase